MPLHRVIGVIPAAGQGSRISPLPMSKELFPVGFQTLSDRPDLRPKVISQYLLETMRNAGISQVFVILRPGKWDIPQYFGNGHSLQMHIAYTTVHVPFGVPFTIDQAYPFINDAIIALGFPDILVHPDHVYQTLLSRLDRSAADVVLGLFPTEQPDKVGVVDVDQDGRVRHIFEKSTITHLKYMWAIAVWTPKFTAFLHQYVQQKLVEYEKVEYEKMPSMSIPEVPIGDVIQAGICAGLPVEAEIFSEGTYLDIGTPENLIRAIQIHTDLPG